MHPDRDFDPQAEIPAHASDLTRDLSLETLLRAMAGDDPFLFDVARVAVLSGLNNELDTILYRQAIVQDCLRHPTVVRELYALAVEAIDRKKKSYFGFFSRYPSGILHSSIELLQMFMGMLARLRKIAELQAGQFESKGFTKLFTMLEREFSDEYFATVQDHLTRLKFKDGVLLSAELGKGAEGTNYVLRRARTRAPNWLDRFLGKGPPAYSFRIHERDEAGARILSELKDRGINLVANAVAQSTEHILGFFDMLVTELAFYVCCLNLHDTLASLGAPFVFPQPVVAGSRTLRFSGLYDVSLAISMGRRVVGNSIDADGKSLVMITGANQGGKSSFLRGVGLAQLMMQAGMFVGAESFGGELCATLFTHYKREEDATMKKGKFDEELSRMSAITDTLVPNAMLLFNEAFAATNEREGSEIAGQVVRALLESRVKVFFVTHLYDFAHSFFVQDMDGALFLRAERQADGTRTFRLLAGEPLDTSYGEDVFRAVFGAEADKVSTST